MSSNQLLAHRVFLAFKDMCCATAYLNAYADLELKFPEQDTLEYLEMKEAILIAVVVTYCRPFKNSRSQGKAAPLLSPEELALFATEPDLAQLHERLVVLRDTTIAHADWTAHSTDLLEVQNDPPRVVRRSPVPQFLLGVDVQNLRRLVSHVLSFCRNKAFDLDIQRVQPHTP